MELENNVVIIIITFTYYTFKSGQTRANIIFSS